MNQTEITVDQESTQSKSGRISAFLRWFILSLLVILALVPQIVGRPTDPAVRNILTMVCGLAATIMFWVWLVRRSPLPRAVRRTFGWLGVAVALVSIACVRFDGFSGNMVPRFRLVWQVPADTRLARPTVQSQVVDLERRTEDDFPQFLGPHRDGTLPDRRIADPRRAPELVWKQPIGAGWCAFAAVHGAAVTMEQRGPEELVTCYDILTGNLLWAHAIEARHETLMGGVGPRATPTIYQGRVLALGATGVLRCLDGATGTLLWQHDLPGEFGVPPGKDTDYVAWGRANSPLAYDDLVVVPAGGPKGRATSLVAYRITDGQLAWKAGDEQISYSSPVLVTLNGRRQLITVNESTVSGHDPVTGELLWKFSWPGSSVQDANTSQPHVFMDTVLVSKGYGGGLARFRIDGNRAEKIYHNRQVLRTKLTSFVILENYGFGLSDGILECVDLRDGQRQWKQGRYEHGQILLVGNHLLVLTENGELAIVEATPEEFRETMRVAALEGPTWNNLCLYGSYLLIRNARQAACYKLSIERNSTSDSTANLLE